MGQAVGQALMAVGVVDAWHSSLFSCSGDNYDFWQLLTAVGQAVGQALMAVGVGVAVEGTIAGLMLLCC